MANSTLRNLSDSSYVRTDPLLATRMQHVLRFPSEAFSVWDPTAGTGSLFHICAHVPFARQFGVEISAERAEECRQAWPNATVVTAAIESVQMQGSVDLLIVNPPYILQNGKRASLWIISETGTHLCVGGIGVFILAARSDWDGHMINHLLKWYDTIRVWKFPDRVSSDQEGAFDDYSQIVIAGVRRATPAEPDAVEKKRLQGYQWKSPDNPGASGWRYGQAPPDLPETAIAHPYVVPSSRVAPRLVVRNADEATLLHALKQSGAHLSPAWQKATTWPEVGYLGSPAMPYTGEAHVAAEVMIGGLDGQIVYGPGPDVMEPHLFTAFVGQEWVARAIDEEVQQKLYEEGCIRVEMRELTDKPILGVLNLARGTTHYYQGEAVFPFLQPWLKTLAARVVERRKPLYRLDPAEWEMRVLAQFGLDKQLPGAPFPGLAIPQLHRVFAMGRSLDVTGRTAIQGEPGTGKTRMATGTAARQGYRWRHRNDEFSHVIQPAWIRGLRRAWLKNPRTLALLGVEPVRGWRFDHRRKRQQDMQEQSPHPSVVAYREAASGRLIPPQEAGPRAFPVLIVTPLKVTKEYAKEIRVAYPQAEVQAIESHRDVVHWLERCAHSSAPVVFGVISHSVKQAFGRRWRPAVLEKTQVTSVLELCPAPERMPDLEEVRDERKGKVIGYRVKATGKMLTRDKTVSHFSCPTCFGRIDATPGRKSIRGAEGEKEPPPPELASHASEEELSDDTEPVTSRTWFQIKRRWCSCEESRRNQDRLHRGKPPIKTLLSTNDRTEAANRKYPQLSFAEWSKVWRTLHREAEHLSSTASTRELVERVRRDDTLLLRLVEVALRDPAVAASVWQVVERVDPEVRELRETLARESNRLAELLLGATRLDDTWRQELVERALADETRFASLLSGMREQEPAVHAQLVSMLQEREHDQTHLHTLIADTMGRCPPLLVETLQEALDNPVFVHALLPEVIALWPRLETRLQALWRGRDHAAFLRVLVRIIQMSPALVSLAALAILQSPRDELHTRLCACAKDADAGVAALLVTIDQHQACLVSLICETIRQCPALGDLLCSSIFRDPSAFASHLVEQARDDWSALVHAFPPIADRNGAAMQQLAITLQVLTRQLAEHLTTAARRDGSGLVLSRLVEQTRQAVDWQAVFFRLAYQHAHLQSQAALARSKRKTVGTMGAARLAAHTRLIPSPQGPIAWDEPDLHAADGYTPVADPSGKVIRYLGPNGTTLTPISSRASGRVIGYRDEATGKEVVSRHSYDFGTPPPDSFSPYDYLYRFLRKSIGKAVVDESHNGKSKDADISQAFRQAMRAAQTRMLTSGTHYGGDILDFYHYWFGFDPSFWVNLGFGWNDAEKALEHYGVIQQWTKEYESDARKGSGKTNTYTSSIPAPGLSAKLIPVLLRDMVYLTVLDVGAHMPPKVEIPKGIAMSDPLLQEARQQANEACAQASNEVGTLQMRQKETQALPDGGEKAALLARVQEQLALAEDARRTADQHVRDIESWIEERDLARAYNALVRTLEEKARKGNTAARLAQGTIPKWFAAMPCDRPYTVYQTERGDWGEKGASELVASTPVLAWNYLYPMERWLIETVKAELAEQRTVMIYIEQVTRSMARRLTWVLEQGGMGSWTLPGNVEAEDRQEVILLALNQDQEDVAFVPYRLVNEGVNLQKTSTRRGILSIIWYEQPMNLFMYLQASQRAWRLGADEEVRIYLPFYTGTAAHTKVHKLGGQSGAAAAFAGEPARGELIKSMGADRTTLARLSASLEQNALFEHEGEGGLPSTDDLSEIEQAFARRNAELVSALKAGRQWLGVKDTLPERFAALMAVGSPDVWERLPKRITLPENGIVEVGALLPQEDGAALVSAPLPVEAPGELPSPVLALRSQEVSGDEAEVKPGDQLSVPLPPPVLAAPVSSEAPLPPPVLLLFGNEEDIKLARLRRGTRPRRAFPKLKNPVMVKEIPAETAARAALAAEKRQADSALELLSWWEVSYGEEGRVGCSS